MNDPIDRLVALERTNAERDALERAAQGLEKRAGNEIYRRAWKAAARYLRALKDGNDVNASYIAGDTKGAVEKQLPGSR